MHIQLLDHCGHQLSVWRSFLGSMARKISADLLKLHEGELGVWKKRKVGDTEEAVFETLLNFDFDILAKVVFARGSGAIYKITIPGDGTK